MFNKNFIIPMLVSALLITTASCAVKGRDESTTANTGGNTMSQAVIQSLTGDMQQLTALAKAFDSTTLHGLAVPESGCTGSACDAVTQACDLFNQAEFLISSYFIKRASYITAGLDTSALDAAIAEVGAATFSDGTCVNCILNDTNELSNLKSVCAVLVSSITLLLQNQMGQLQTQMASMQQTLIDAVNNGIPGPTGAVGLQGATGPMGSTGLQGLAGPAGSTGAQGVAGPQGAIGPQGLRGVTGPAGVAGATGPVGATGPIGVAGPTGSRGSTGPTGSAGLQGNPACFRTGQCTTPPTGFDCCLPSRLGVWFQAGTAASIIAGCQDSDYSTFSALCE